MTGPERGFLLLCSHLGDPERKPLTAAQLRILASRARDWEPGEKDRKLTEKDLIGLGYEGKTARHILNLLSEETLLDVCLKDARRQGCVPITRLNEKYPLILRKRLGLDSPGCLWAKGDLKILNTPAVSLVGSRELREENRRFAQQVGREAARQGITLVSGNARGADRTAQEACLEAGGKVISIVADDLSRQKVRENLLYLSEEDYCAAFSSQRALSRNRCIHAMGSLVFVAQSDLGHGGTWDGTVKNLRFGWSPVACFRDGSESAARLEQMGAYLIGSEDLRDLASLRLENPSFL